MREFFSQEVEGLRDKKDDFCMDGVLTEYVTELVVVKWRFIGHVGVAYVVVGRSDDLL